MTDVALDVARRWRQAAQDNAMETFRELYSPTAIVWSSRDRASVCVEDHVAHVAAARASCDVWEYRDVRCQATDSGFVSEHTVRFGRNGRTWTTVAAIVGDIEHGRIVRLAEYLNPAVEDDREAPG